MRRATESSRRPPAPETRLIFAICVVLFVLGAALIEYGYLTPQSTTGSTSSVGTSSSSSSSSTSSSASTASLIPVGAAPYGLAYDSATGQAFVAVSGANSVAILGNQSTVTGEVELGGAADFLAFDPANSLLYAALVGNDSIAVINVTLGQVISHVAAPTSGGWMAYDPANESVFAVDRESNLVSVISGTTVTKFIPLQGLPFAVAYDATDGDMYVTNNDGAVFVIDGTNDTLVSTIQVAGNSSNLLGATFDPYDGNMYVTDYTDNSVYILNGTQVAGPITGFDEPIGIASGLAGEIYVVNSGNDTLSIQNTGASGFVSTPVGSDPREVLFDPALYEVLVTDYGSSSLTSLSGPGLPSLSPVLAPAWRTPRTVGSSAEAMGHSRSLYTYMETPVGLSESRQMVVS